jgi:hypothetical protein
MTRTSRLRTLFTATAIAAAFMATPFAAQATTLSDNSTQASADTLTATATDWLAASFTMDADYGTATLEAVLQASTVSGASILTLYSSDASGLIPANYLATFQTLGNLDASTTFSLSGISLQSGTSYWVVLSNATGGSTWSWTESSEGTGSGFTGVWANSDDAGGVWFTNSSLYPLQLSVSASSVPEPMSCVLWLSGLGLLGAARRSRQSARIDSSNTQH